MMIIKVNTIFISVKFLFLYFLFYTSLKVVVVIRIYSVDMYKEREREVEVVFDLPFHLISDPVETPRVPFNPIFFDMR